MTTIRSDVLVLGSTLGGLVAANYLARAGLRVVLLEEEVHAKRPTLLRDPFMLSGLASGGPVMRVLRELALPLIEQREIQRSDVSLARSRGRAGRPDPGGSLGGRDPPPRARHRPAPRG